MNYRFYSENRGSHFLNIEFTIEKNTAEIVELQLPAWRPGRYELANFAQNIQQFEVKTMNNKPLVFEKISKDKWAVNAKGIESFKICYNYYANELNAGSTWVNEDQIYINPVNCCLYVVGRENDPIRVFVETAANEQTVTSLQKLGNHFVANNFDELADAPFITSASLQQKAFVIENTTLNIWFQGECKPNWKKLIRDFTQFSQAQYDLFGSFPFKEYHFLFQILPFSTYHGVEHLSSTVISLGPGFGIFEQPLYNELLGVSSHELFHAWNVKTIRPADMLPYDFTKENYTKMGYLTEGVTTYYGDLMLWRSEVFDTATFLEQINKTLDRHFWNYGVNNLSVAESSFDTWLDGYKKGIPNRKSSIYTEGCLLALATDLYIQIKSHHQKSLDNVLFACYEHYKNGITEEQYLEFLVNFSSPEFKGIWNNYYYGTFDYFDLLKELLEDFGLQITKNDNTKFLAAHYGYFTQPGTSKALMIGPNSPAYKIGLNPGDEIISINNIAVVNENCNDWAAYFKGPLELQVKKDGFVKNVLLPHSSKTFFPKVSISENTKATAKQLQNLKKWKYGK